MTLGNRIFLTCYTGYALEARNPGKMDDLRRHVLCIGRDSGKIVWSKEFDGYRAESNLREVEGLNPSDSFYFSVRPRR